MKPTNPGTLGIRQITTLGLCTALIFGVQVALAPLANVELVSLLVILYALHFGRRALFILYIFALLEGLFYGFGLWWIMYLYVWPILWLISMLLRRQRNSMVWALVAAVFGLSFGFMCAFPYLVTGGWAMALSWWIAGIPYDLIHCVSNFVIVLILFKPINQLFETMKQRGLIPE